MKKFTLFYKILENYQPYTSIFFLSHMFQKVIFYITGETEEVYPLGILLAGMGFAMIAITIYRHYIDSE